MAVSQLPIPITKKVSSEEKCTSATFPTAIRFTPRVRTWKLTRGRIREKSLMSARGKAAVGSLRGRTNWPDITANTLAPNLSSAICAKDNFLEVTICRCTWKDTELLSKCFQIISQYSYCLQKPSSSITLLLLKIHDEIIISKAWVSSSSSLLRCRRSNLDRK